MRAFLALLAFLTLFSMPPIASAQSNKIELPISTLIPVSVPTLCPEQAQTSGRSGRRRCRRPRTTTSTSTSTSTTTTTAAPILP